MADWRAAQVTGKEQDRRDRGGVSGMLESELPEPYQKGYCLRLYFSFL